MMKKIRVTMNARTREMTKEFMRRIIGEWEREGFRY